MELYVAKILATAQDKAVAGHVTLFQVLLSWFIPATSRSVDLFASGRLVMVVIFWFNWMLLAACTGARLLSRRWLVALILVGTLAPLWDYGFEIRHDNLMLTGLLLLWGTVRFGPTGWYGYFFVGVIAAALEFIAFKSFAYTLPISLMILVSPRPGHNLPRWKLFLAWSGGVILTCLILRVWFGIMGIWDLFLMTNQFLSTASAKGHGFGPGLALKRLLTQTPLLLALVLPGLVSIVADVRRRGKLALNWEGALPEALLFLVAFGVLIVNPAPFPYNVLHLVPYAFLFVFRYGITFWDRMKSSASHETLCLCLSLFVFAHLVPFGIATFRHLEWSNSRQEHLMGLAEDLTDPAKDPVYDGIGMVSTRRIVDPHGFLHSLNFASFISSGPQIRDMLANNPAPVLIPSYRTDWLPQQDHDYIDEHYVSLADDFWVLGKVLPQGGGTFEVIHPGRYRISTIEGSDLAGTYAGGLDSLRIPEQEGKVTGFLDGNTLTNQVVELPVGTHFLTNNGSQAAVVWVGPRQNRLHRLPQSDHRRLFVNWY
ncbi:MAG: hypothetical protein ACTHLW_19675 [Verrucomicrobiota bacterium]